MKDVQIYTAQACSSLDWSQAEGGTILSQENVEAILLQEIGLEVFLSNRMQGDSSKFLSMAPAAAMCYISAPDTCS